MTDAEANSRVQQNLGIQISYFRKKRGLTQSQLAELMSVEPETISRFERGTATPSIQRLIGIADALEVGVHHLLTRSSPLMSDKVELLGEQLEQLSRTDKDLVLGVALTLAKRLSAR